MGIGASVHASTNNDGWTPVIAAARYGHFDIVRILAENGASVDAKNNWGETVLSRAAISGHFEVCNLLLLDFGARYETSFMEKYGGRMVSAAAANEEYQNVRNLVEYGADPSNSLYDACKGGDMRIVNYLLEKGVDVKKNDSSKCLSIALELDHMEVFDTLIKKGANVQSVSV